MAPGFHSGRQSGRLSYFSHVCARHEKQLRSQRRLFFLPDNDLRHESRRSRATRAALFPPWAKKKANLPVVGCHLTWTSRLPTSMQSPHELITFLTRNQFRSPSQAESLGQDRHRYLSAVQLCTELVQRGWLTAYQQAQLLSGHGEKLIIGSYRVQLPLGEGGMGMVFKAIQPKLRSEE